MCSETNVPKYGSLTLPLKVCVLVASTLTVSPTIKVVLLRRLLFLHKVSLSVFFLSTFLFQFVFFFF